MLRQLFALVLAMYSAMAFAALDVNSATQAQLTEIRGIGPATATRILDARAQGPFKSWEDLIARVKGIAPTSAGKFSDAGLTVNGRPFASPAAPATTSTSPAAPGAAKPAQTTGKKPEKG